MNLTDYTPTSDLSRAWTIPARWYTEAGFLELEKEKIFGKRGSWSGESTWCCGPVIFLPASCWASRC